MVPVEIEGEEEEEEEPVAPMFFGGLFRGSRSTGYVFDCCCGAVFGFLLWAAFTSAAEAAAWGVLHRGRAFCSAMWIAGCWMWKERGYLEWWKFWKDVRKDMNRKEYPRGEDMRPHREERRTDRKNRGQQVPGRHAIPAGGDVGRLGGHRPDVPNLALWQAGAAHRGHR